MVDFPRLESRSHASVSGIERVDYVAFPLPDIDRGAPSMVTIGNYPGGNEH
jgi:hypothetical protein